MADRRVVHQLIRALGQVHIRFHQAKALHRTLSGRIVRCDAFFQGNPNQNGFIDVALRAHVTGEQLIHTIVHELLHYLGYNEGEVSGKLDDELCTHGAVRAAVATHLVGMFLQPRRKHGKPTVDPS